MIFIWQSLTLTEDFRVAGPEFSASKTAPDYEKTSIYFLLHQTAFERYARLSPNELSAELEMALEVLEISGETAQRSLRPILVPVVFSRRSRSAFSNTSFPDLFRSSTEN